MSKARSESSARTTCPVDRLPQTLRDVFTAASGTHPDWAEFDRVMAAERRATVLVEPARLASNP